MIFLICLEIMSICVGVWVARAETKETLKASKTYLSVAMSGSAVIWLGLLLLQDAVGTLSINELSEMVQAVWSERSTQIYVAGFCMLIGLWAKVGMFPFHFWLIKVQKAVSAQDSAVLFCILIPCDIVGVLILTAEGFLHDRIWGTVLLILGVITMVVGAMLAIFSVNLKRTLACSSVSQIGFIMVGVGMQCFLEEHNALAIRENVLQLINHSLMMFLLFNISGVVYNNLHKLDLNDMQGFGRQKPFLMVCFLMGVFGNILIGNDSFVSFKGIEMIFLISSGLNIACMLKLFVCLFIEIHPSKQVEYDEKINYMTPFSKVVLGFVAIILWMVGIYEIGDVATEMLFISIGIGVVIYFAMIRTVFMKKQGAIDVSNILERIIRSPKAYIYPWSEVGVIEVFCKCFFRKLIWVVGGICKVIDEMPEKIFQYMVILTGAFGKILDAIPDTITGILQKTVFVEMAEEKE